MASKVKELEPSLCGPRHGLGTTAEVPNLQADLSKPCLEIKVGIRKLVRTICVLCLHST